MSYFHLQLPILMKRRGLSKSALSKAMGRQPSYISNLLREEADPKLSTLRHLAEILRCNIDDLDSPGPIYSVEAVHGKVDVIATRIAGVVQRTVSEELSRIEVNDEAPIFENFIEFWIAQGGVLTEGYKFSEFVDTYYAPRSDTALLVSQRMGKRSAAADKFNFTSTNQLNDELARLPRDVAVSLANAQRLTIETNQPRLTVEQLELPSPNGPVLVVYQRLYTPWKDTSGRKYVVNLSKPVSTQVGITKNLTAAAKPSLLDGH